MDLKIDHGQEKARGCKRRAKKPCSLVGSNHRPQDNSIVYETYALPTELKELERVGANKVFIVYVCTYTFTYVRWAQR